MAGAGGALKDSIAELEGNECLRCRSTLAVLQNHPLHRFATNIEQKKPRKHYYSVSSSTEMQDFCYSSKVDNEFISLC